MTSLQTSVTGGLTGGNTYPVPAEAVTMAEHMHRAGYQTAVFTGNPNAGTLSDLQRGSICSGRTGRTSHTSVGVVARSPSKYLHEGFWIWREDYPSQPFWAHFQTTDTHGDFPAPPPFGGLFVTADEWESWNESFERLSKVGGPGRYGGRDPYSPAWDSTGISRTAFYSVAKGLYDEAMAHNDYRLGQLIDRLKVEGEWDNTLLIIGAITASGRLTLTWGLVLSDPLPPPWSQPILRPTISRVPLMFVWPGHIEGGQRIAPPVSMIDVLPTLLDLLGLPPAEIAQGQSLAPLMLGREGWEPRPVISDEFYADFTTGELEGVIEVVDGRWGASLEINRPGCAAAVRPPSRPTAALRPLERSDGSVEPARGTAGPRPKVHSLLGGAVRGPRGPVAVLHARRGFATDPGAATVSSGTWLHTVTPGTNSTIILTWFEELKRLVPTGRYRSARPLWMIMCACLLAFPALGCGGGDDRAYSRGSTVIISYCCGNEALNPSHDMGALNLVFLPLATRDPQGQLVGRLATSWEPSPDYRERTYHLRTDVRWHDGVPVTAHDIVFTM